MVSYYRQATRKVTNQLALFRKISCVCYGRHTGQIHTQCGQNVEFIGLNMVVQRARFKQFRASLHRKDTPYRHKPKLSSTTSIQKAYVSAYISKNLVRNKRSRGKTSNVDIILRKILTHARNVDGYLYVIRNSTCYSTLTGVHIRRRS